MTDPGNNPAQSDHEEAMALLKEAERLGKIRATYGGVAQTGGSSGGASIIGWMISNNLARDQVQANYILLGVSAIAIATSFVLLLHPSFNSFNSASPGTQSIAQEKLNEAVANLPHP